jgi:hypothetical protein
MLLFAFYASTHMVAAGDTWVALACGRHFAEHGVDNVEPFSFNSHPAGPTEEQLKDWPAWTHGMIRYWHPTGWINQNWLTHLIFYKLASWFGSEGHYNYDTLVAWKFALYTLTVLCVFAIGKTIGAGDLLSALAACMGMVVGRSFFDIRPAGYSNLLGPAFILVLALATYRHWRYIWLLVPLVVFWANVHGGYIYAFIMLVPFAGIHLLLLLPKRWTISLGVSGLWLVLYLMSYKFLTHEYYVQLQTFLNPQFKTVSLFNNSLFVIWILLAVVSVGLAAIRKVSDSVFYLYHVLAGFVYVVSLLSRYLTGIPSTVNLTSQFRTLLSYHISSSQVTFVFFGLFAGLLIAAMAFKKERFIALPVKGLIHTCAAGAVSFIAMVIFNPYHLTNLTHTFEISVSKHAESWRQVNEWKPAFDWMDKTTSIPNPVGDEEWFGVLCILTGIAMVVWPVVYFVLKPRLTGKASRKTALQSIEIAAASTWPKVDLAILMISLMTIYMAIQSRRFIAMAGSVSAPAIFLLIYQIWKMGGTRFQQLRIETLKRSAAILLRGVTYGGLAVVVLGLGVLWGNKYYQVYLSPFPAENRYHSVFMRMTASHIKPFEVCEFINQNHLTGRVFNYWTEGGAVAFGQIPDPQTGHIPLKLFMDGRAQAAYNHDIFTLWQEINSGGPIARDLMRQGKDVKDWTTKDFQAIGSWIDKQLKERQVWVTLMPNSQESSVFMRSLSSVPNWKTGYTDNTQHLLIDTDSDQGKSLLTAILEGKACFPDAVSRSLTTTTAIYENNYVQRTGDLYAIAREGFDVFPYPSVTIALTRTSGVPAFREIITKDMKTYLEDFTKNREAYQKQNGYLHRLASAEIAARYLAQRDETTQKSFYLEKADGFKKESQEVKLNRLW